MSNARIIHHPTPLTDSQRLETNKNKQNPEKRRHTLFLSNSIQINLIQTSPNSIHNRPIIRPGRRPLKVQRADRPAGEAAEAGPALPMRMRKRGGLHSEEVVGAGGGDEGGVAGEGVIGVIEAGR